MRQEWFSIDSYCRHVYFKLPVLYKIQDGVKKKYVDETTKLSVTGNEVVLCKNDFPYHFDAGIDHWVLWSAVEPSEEEVGVLVEEKFPKAEFDVLIMNNPNKTIKTIFHLHIYARKTL